jgi:two-component system response regulator HydG
MESGRKVAWIIDDEVDLCLLMKSYLLRKNYEVRISHNYSDVLHALEQGLKPDYVLFDPTTTCDNPDEVIKAIQQANPNVQINIAGY